MISKVISTDSNCNSNSDTSSNPINTGSGSLLHNSMNDLEQYRKKQASQLNMRLNIFKQTAINKYGSLDKIENEGGSPLESSIDIEIIEKMINLRTFVTIPIFKNTSTGNVVTHCYTLGMWYYWGLPEFMIELDTPINMQTDFINIITNIIYDELFFIFKNEINNTDSPNNIKRIDFQSEFINIDLDKFDMKFKLKQIKEENYMDTNTPYMMWFYMYYMEAMTDDENKPKLYPFYQLSINDSDFKSICTKIIDILIEKSFTETDSDSSDTETDIGTDIDTDIDTDTDTDADTDINININTNGDNEQ